MEKINIEVVYASPTKNRIVKLQLDSNATVLDAINASNLLAEFPEIDLNQNKVGIFSKRAELTTQLTAGDRVEIYRSLLIDPKQARLLRAKNKDK